MKMQKNVLRAAACAAVSAVMAAMILTACGSSGAPSSSGANGTGSGGAASSTPASSPAAQAVDGIRQLVRHDCGKGNQDLAVCQRYGAAEYTSQKDGSSFVNHYLCAVSGENVYVLTYDSSDKASTAFVQKDGAIYAIDGKYMSKAPSASGMISSAKTGCQLPDDGRSRNHDHREVHGQWPGIRCGDPEKDGLWPPGELHLLL